MIKVKNISKKYNQNVAIDNISFEIGKGEIVGLLGPNGAGKTTTMRMVTGYLIPDNGEIIIGGDINIKENPLGAKSIIGYMPENNPLYKDLTVEESLNYACDIHQIDKEKRNEVIKQVVEDVGLKEVFYRPISELSKGYKQRVGIALVLVHDPKILILDEPTEGLDPNQRGEIRNLIKKIGKDKTVIISTHVLQEVEAMCSRIIVINQGNIAFDGKREELSSDTSEIEFQFLDKSKDIQNKIKSSFKTTSSSDDFVIKSKSINDDIRKINTFAKDNNLIISKIVQRKQTLEDIFKNLTKVNPK